MEQKKVTTYNALGEVSCIYEAGQIGYNSTGQVYLYDEPFL